mmetsp:Transcript_18489/g.42152  ORF Transcript_18489/g.42152 Transcript_18489/m.42152 type:complete len:198 (-) Transcript_18489:145-738(-)
MQEKKERDQLTRWQEKNEQERQKFEEEFARKQSTCSKEELDEVLKKRKELDEEAAALAMKQLALDNRQHEAVNGEELTAETIQNQAEFNHMPSKKSFQSQSARSSVAAWELENRQVFAEGQEEIISSPTSREPKLLGVPIIVSAKDLLEAEKERGFLYSTMGRKVSLRCSTRLVAIVGLCCVGFSIMFVGLASFHVL